MVQAGRSPVLEKGIDEIVAESSRACRLSATTNVAEAVETSDASFICVGTPNLQNGEHDLRQINRVIWEIGTAMRRKDGSHTVVLRSTVMPGTTESVVIPRLEDASGKRAVEDFGVCYNPEFLREGSAVSDFLDPTITALGAVTPDHLREVREIYAWVPSRIFETSLSTAETVKSICNVFHALKVVFANEIGTLCKRMGIDTKAVLFIYGMTEGRPNIRSLETGSFSYFHDNYIRRASRSIDSVLRRGDLHVVLEQAGNLVHICFQIYDLGRALSTAFRQFATQLGTVDKPQDRACQRIHVAWRYGESVDPIANQFWYTCNPSADARDSPGHGFHKYHWQSFRKTWEHQGVGNCEKALQFFLIQESFEDYVLFQADGGRVPFKFSSVGTIASDIKADVSAGIHDFAQRIQQQVLCLLRSKPADTNQAKRYRMVSHNSGSDYASVDS
jgi:hypothetical protein